MKAKKICILGRTRSNPAKSYSWFVKTTYQGLSMLGHQVYGINYKENSLDYIWKKLIETRPDVVLTHLTFHAKWQPIHEALNMFDSLRSRYDTKIVHTVQDARTQPRYKGNVSDAFDLALVGQTQSLKQLSKTWKVPTYHFPYASLVYKSMAPYNAALSYSAPVFLGSPNVHVDRSAFIEKLKRKVNLKIIKTKSPGDLKEQTWSLSSNAKCILGLCTGYNIRGYIDCRPWQYLGAGAFMIIRKFKGMDKYIPDNLYIPISDYSEASAEFIKNRFNQCLNEDTIPRRMKAFNFIQKHHSSVVRMRNMMNVIYGKQNSLKAKLNEI